MFAVEATNPPTLTCEVEPKSRPFGLTRNTRPFDESMPLITEALASSTRLSTADEAEGCAKVVVLPAPMLKLCQLMIAPFELVTVSTLPAVAKLALPDTTAGPLGSICANAGAATQVVNAAISARDLPCIMN